MLNTKQPDVIISGAGVAGLSLALLLSNAGLRITLIEPMQKPNAKTLKLGAVNQDIGTRTIALMNDTLETLAQAGIINDINPHMEDLRALQIIDAGDVKDKEITFTSDEIDLPRFGANIPNAILSKALISKAAKDKNITILYDNEVESFASTATNITVSLKNKKNITAALLVGADGRNSKVRSLCEIDTEIKDSQQRALTCILDAEQCHNCTSTEFHYEGGPFTLVPLPEGKVSLVWVEKQSRAEYWLDQDSADQESEINAMAKGLLGHLTLISKIDSYPLISLQAKRVTDARIALIAEAAHVLHPMGAQGLNASLRDVAILAEKIITAAGCGIDFGGAITLNQYAAQRHSDAATRNKFSFNLNKMVANDSWSLKLLRRFGLGTLQQHSHLRHAIMRYGLAPYKQHSSK
jgi:2-octaprenyl-6-methoxyphenol hydroxylase